MADKGGKRRMLRFISTTYGLCRSFNWNFTLANLNFLASDQASAEASAPAKGGRSMTYPLSKGLFLENGPAAAAAAARARRASLDAFYLTERTKLEAARIVAGADFCLAA
jgi:hypothetical protein